VAAAVVAPRARRVVPFNPLHNKELAMVIQSVLRDLYSIVGNECINKYNVYVCVGERERRLFCQSGEVKRKNKQKPPYFLFLVVVSCEMKRNRTSAGGTDSGFVYRFISFTSFKTKTNHQV